MPDIKDRGKGPVTVKRILEHNFSPGKKGMEVLHTKNLSETCSSLIFKSASFHNWRARGMAGSLYDLGMTVYALNFEEVYKNNHTKWI